MPYLTCHGVIPPRNVLNEVFTSGGGDAGMSPGAVWEPFSISEGEYTSLVADLLELDLHDVATSRPGKVRTEDTICGFRGDWTENPLRVDHRDSGKIRARSSDIQGLIVKRHNHASGADQSSLFELRHGTAG